MQILVTGGAGFIGSHLVERLLREAHSVFVLDDLSSGARKNLPADPRLTLVEGPVAESIDKLRGGTFDAIAHLAARPSVAQSWTDLMECHRANLTDTLSMIAFCRDQKIPRFVLASSAAVYGGNAPTPTSETAETRPASPYGVQKLCGEHYLRIHAQEFGFQGIAIRPFNVYGPRQQPTSSYSGVISKFAQAMKSGVPIILHGDGTQARDFVYVADAAEAFALALTKELPPAPFAVVNLGTGHCNSLLSLVETMTPLFPDWPGETQHEPKRAGDIHLSQANTAFARELLGFTAHTPLADGLRALADSSK